MNYFADNTNFYPTPPEMAARMITKVDITKVKYILEPSAGKGDLIDFVKEYGYIMDDDWILREFCKTNGVRRNDETARAEAARIACKMGDRGKYYKGFDIDCVELDENLRHILRGKEYRVEGDDFLRFHTEKKYDLILMNPPFDRGDEHLLKAIELQKRFGGEIVCLLNAETIRNPYTNQRKELAKQLKEYGADFEYVEDGFVNAERKTGVEVVIVHVIIPDTTDKRSVLLDELAKAERVVLEDAEEYNALVTNDVIQGAVIMYREEVKAGKRIIQEYNAVRPLLNSTLTVDENASESDRELLGVPILQLVCGDNGGKYSYQPVDFNEYLHRVRYKYWYELLHKPAFLGNLTSNLRNEYFSKIQELADCEFSLSNIYQVKIDILNNMVRGIEDKILELFEKFTYKHSCDCENNIHYYNGWKTNKAYIINKKVVVPWMRTWDDIWKKFKYNYEISEFLADIEKTLEFLDVHKFERDTTRNLFYWLQYYEDVQQTKNMVFNFFDVTVYKKGTMHITFTDEELLHRLNIYGSQKKGWLPPSYGKKRYADMDDEEKAVIDEFEGEESYNIVFENKDKFLIESSTLLMLGDGN